MSWRLRLQWVENGHCGRYVYEMSGVSLFRSTAVLLLAVTGISCRPSASQILTVDEVDRRADQLNGQKVSVAGYLAECGGYECDLFRDKAGADEWHRWGAILRQTTNPPPSPSSPWLAIGEGINFDAKAAPFRNSYVVISGTVRNVCRYKGQHACLDRGNDIDPTDIRRGNLPTDR